MRLRTCLAALSLLSLGLLSPDVHAADPASPRGKPLAALFLGDRVSNAMVLQSTFGTIPPKMPRVVNLPVNATAKAIRLLGGVSVFDFPARREGSVSTIVRVAYVDGSTEKHELKNGVHFTDVNRAKDVSGPTLAYKLGSLQVRYLTVVPKKKETITRIELVKGSGRSAPIVPAATVEGFE